MDYNKKHIENSFIKIITFNNWPIVFKSLAESLDIRNGQIVIYIKNHEAEKLKTQSQSALDHTTYRLQDIAKGKMTKKNMIITAKEALAVIDCCN